MLHSKNISVILRQTLTPIKSHDNTEIGPSSVSLLSPLFHPLCSVFSDEAAATSEGADEQDEDNTLMSLKPSQNAKIYSMVASNEFNHDLEWEILELDNHCYISLNKFKIDDGVLILMMVCNDKFPKKLSKKRLDNLSQVLQNGLKGYNIE